MLNDIDRILITREQIAQRVQALAQEIAGTYPDPNRGLTLVTILSGSIIFLADLIRYLPIRMKIGLVAVSSYQGATTVGSEPKLLDQLHINVAGEHVLIIDDILDTGRTLRLVQQQMWSLGPASVRTCVLLHKSGKAVCDVKADFVGFEIEDAFVVGYGLDFDDHYRNFPHIGVLKPELYERQGSG